MANDFLMQAALGALEGFNSAYTPYKKLEAQSLFEQKQKQADRQAQLDQFKAEQPLKEASLIREQGIRNQGSMDLEKYKHDLASPTPLYNEKTGQFINLPPGADKATPFNPGDGGVEKATKIKNERLTKLGEALDPSKQRTGAFGVSKSISDRAERLQNLAAAYKNTGDLRSSEIEELAIGLNAMLSGSNTGAQEQVKGLIPDTAVGNYQKLKEFLLNNPQGTKQKAFIDRMLGSVGREKATADEQMKRTRYQRISQYPDVEQNSPNEFNDSLLSYGVDPTEYKTWKKNGFKPMSAVQGQDQGGLAAPAIGGEQIGTGQYTPAQLQKLQALQAQH